PVTLENKANKTAGPKEANNSAGTKDNLDAGNSEMEVERVPEYFVLPLWSFFTSIVKCSTTKNRDEKLNKDTGSKINKEPVDQEDQAFLEELKKRKRQEKEANDATKTLKKTFALNTEDLLLQAGVARASSTNYVNIVSTPVNTDGTTATTASPSRNVSAAGASNPNLLPYANQDDYRIPSLEDIYEVPNDRIFTSASYDDEGAVADFTNLKSTMNVSPIPQSRIHFIHPTTQILVDPHLVVQIRSKVNKSSRAHALHLKMKVGLMLCKKSCCNSRLSKLEAIRIFLAFTSYMEFKVYQMNVKSVFLYGKIDEEVYVSQPPGFIDPKFPKKAYKVVKALYGLHQALRAWYATLSTFLVKSGYRRGIIDKTLFIKDQKDIMLDKYVAEILKKFDFISVKTASTLTETEKNLVKDTEAADVDVSGHSKDFTSSSCEDDLLVLGQPKLGLWYPRESGFDLEAYSDSDYAGANLDRKSTTGGCQFLGGTLITWQCKKQTIVDTSTTEAEHHFIRDAYEKKLIRVLKIHTDDNVADLLTKAFDVSRSVFSNIRSLGEEHVSKQREDKKAKTRLNIEDGKFNKLDDLVGEGVDYVVNKGSKELASPKQTDLGKDFSNPLMVDSLPKTIWLSMHHVIAIKHWLFQSKRLLNTAPLQTLDRMVHDLNRFFNGVKCVVDLDFIQRYGKCFAGHALLQLKDVKSTVNLTQLVWEFKSIGNGSNFDENLKRFKLTFITKAPTLKGLVRSFLLRASAAMFAFTK
nr:hypothetical protein [Tanacetum cinerariifolium]